MLGSGKWAPDADGSYFVDRNPKYFDFILDFLRTGEQPHLSSLPSEALEKLRKDVDYYQVPMEFSPPLDSTIVPSLPPSFAVWLPRKTFRLLYRASRDGFQAAQFHARCDNQGPTLVLIRSTNNYVFGGYAGASWNSSESWINDPQACLFSLSNPSGTGPHWFVCQSPAYALCGSSSYGPLFGRGNDLRVVDNCNSAASPINFPSSYTDTSGQGRNVFVGSNSFVVSDMEVFAVQ